MVVLSDRITTCFPQNDLVFLLVMVVVAVRSSILFQQPLNILPTSSVADLILESQCVRQHPRG